MQNEIVEEQRIAFQIHWNFVTSPEGGLPLTTIFHIQLLLILEGDLIAWPFYLLLNLNKPILYAIFLKTIYPI